MRCFVVVTREARDTGGEVHDRMPAFVTADTMDAWLEPVSLNQPRREDLLATLDSASAAVASTDAQANLSNPEVAMYRISVEFRFNV